ncbi:MAG: SMP-30/gluconolactonase/LRE family protein [Actinomycetota bacterium]
MSRTTILVDGLQFPECPRWRDGRLWFSDVHAHRVCSVGPGGDVEVVLELDDRPTGLGFLPDGSLLVCSADRRLVLRLHDGQTTVHADLGSLPVEWLNDMVVTPDGRAYVDAIAHVEDPGGDEPVDKIVVVDPDGAWRVAAERALRPNGIAVTPDGATLLHASTRRRKVIEWTIGAEGLLHDPRVWAETGRWTPDGLCLDAEGAVWIGALAKQHFVRMRRGGEVDSTIEVPGRWATACMLGGDDRQTLFMATADPDSGRGYIEIAETAVAGAGSP